MGGPHGQSHHREGASPGPPPGQGPGRVSRRRAAAWAGSEIRGPGVRGTVAPADTWLWGGQAVRPGALAPL